VTPNDPFSDISVQKMFKTDSKIDCVYPVRFWGSYHLLDTQMTNFMTRATQILNRTQKEKYKGMSSRSTESWEWYSITCPCGNPFAYRPMIQSGIHRSLL